MSDMHVGVSLRHGSRLFHELVLCNRAGDVGTGSTVAHRAVVTAVIAGLDGNHWVTSRNVQWILPGVFAMEEWGVPLGSDKSVTDIGLIACVLGVLDQTNRLRRAPVNGVLGEGTSDPSLRGDRSSSQMKSQSAERQL